MLFARQGYTTTGVREVAALAGVNATLIRRYFSSKEGLFRAAVEEFLKVEPFLDGERSQFGKRAVEILIAGEEVPSALAMMLLATADAEARTICSDMFYQHVSVPLADWLGGSEAMARAGQIHVLWIGYMAARQVLPLRTLSEDSVGLTREWLAQATQAIVDQAD